MEQKENFGPFSMEKAYQTYRDNMSEAARLKDEIENEKREGTGTDRELLLKTVEALGRLTDNTILKRIVEKSLREREGL